MIVLNSANILIILLILLIFYLYVKKNIIENLKNLKGIDSVLNISNDQNKSNNLYIFRGNKCNLYDNKLKIAKDYPVDIQYDFKDIPSNITTSFKWSDNKIYFIKNNVAFLYNISDKHMIKKHDSKDINEFIGGDNVSVTSWVNDEFIAFRENKYTIFSKDNKSSEIKTIPINLPFLENMDDITKWNSNQTETTFYVFKHNSFRRFSLLNGQTELQKLKIIDHNLKEIVNEHFQNISLLLDYSLDNKLNCPNNFKLDDVNDNVCIHKTKSIKCSLVDNTKMTKCDSICMQPIISSKSDRFKYNEAFAFLIFPNNFLGQDTNISNINFDNTLNWEFDKNIFYCEPLDDCILEGEDIPFLEYNKPFKLKNLVTKKELQLDNEGNTSYIFHKISDEHIKDGISLKICINESCNKYYKNGINDLNEIVTIYKLATINEFKNNSKSNILTNITTFNNQSGFDKNILLNDQDTDSDVNSDNADDAEDVSDVDDTNQETITNPQNSKTINSLNNINTIDDYECYTDSNGKDYRGTQNITIAGNQCKKWSTQLAKRYKNQGISDEHNYCRNPTNQPHTYCYTDVNDPTKIGYCNVGLPQKKCKKDFDNKNDICNLTDCQDYSGTLNLSGIGNECINWSSVDSNLFSNMTHNYCRNPIKQLKEDAYCYTSRNKTDGWEYCNIPLNPNKCNIKENKILAGFTIQENGVYYLFRNIYIQDKKIIIYCSVSISNHEIKELGIVNRESWPNLPFIENIDAIYYDDLNNIIYFFNGSQICLYNIKSRMQESVKQIADIFPNIPMSFQNGISCIINKLDTNSAYLIKNNNYVEFWFSSGKSSDIYSINKLIPNLSNITLFDASISYKTSNSSICVVFKNNLFYYIDITPNSETYGFIDNKKIENIETTYYNFWNIDINSPIFNKQKIHIEDNNMINISLFINEINKAGSFSNYLKQTNQTIENIAKTYNLSYEDIIKAAEYGILSLKKKRVTNPLRKKKK